MTPHLVLASQSSVRKELLTNAGLRFDCVPAHVDEAGIIARHRGQGPAHVAGLLARAKAGAVSAEHGDDLVIGADQLLILEGVMLQKPENLEAARRRLGELSGKTHHLVTAAVIQRGAETVFAHVETGALTMHALTPGDIDAQIAREGEALLWSVGAYRLEGPGISLFAAIEGDYFALLGLPLVPLMSALRRLAPDLLIGATPE